MKRVGLNSRVRKAFPAHSGGFTLIEVVIAIALIGLIGLSVLSALSTASLALIIADQRAAAESLARSQWEYVKSQQYSPAPTGGVGNYTKITGVPAGYSVCSVDRNGQTVNCGPNDGVVGVPWDSGNNTALNVDNGLQKIRLIIRHDDEVLVALEDYRRNPKE